MTAVELNCVINHIDSISFHITPIVINSLRSGHTHTHANTPTHLQTSTLKQFKKAGMSASGQYVDGFLTL